MINAKELYIGNEAVKEVYLGSNLIWPLPTSNNVITTIRIDQSVSDPSTMITRTVDEGGIEAIRANSHRYTGLLNNEGIMELKQLDDKDSTKYLDGTDANLTTYGTDVWMKLPLFYYKVDKLSSDVYDLSFAYGERPNVFWKKWDGKDLIGVYKSTLSSNKAYSISNKGVSTARVSEWTTYSNNRGTGYKSIQWKHHCIMVFLFYAYYGTVFSADICGSGTSTYGGSTGISNNKGMFDSSSSDSFVNFWGLENWWTQMNEFIDNTSFSHSSGILTITNDDNTIKQFKLPVNYNLERPKKIAITNELDYYPIELNNSDTIFFPERFGKIHNNGNAQTLIRSGYKNIPDKPGLIGVANMSFWVTGWSPDGASGSRLTYRGDYVILGAEKITFHVDLYNYHPRNGYYLYQTVTFETPYKTWGESLNIYDTTNQCYISDQLSPSGGTLIGVRTDKSENEWGQDGYYITENGEDISNEQIIAGHTYSLYYFS